MNELIQKVFDTHETVYSKFEEILVKNEINLKDYVSINYAVDHLLLQLDEKEKTNLLITLLSTELWIRNNNNQFN